MMAKLKKLADVWSVPSFQGEAFFKHGNIGRPNRKIVEINRDGTHLRWGNKDKQIIDLRKVDKVIRGKQTKIFEKSPKLDEQLCFSLITSKRTLDLHAFNRGQRNVWYAALSALTGFARKKFVKMRRECIDKHTNS